MANGRSYWLTGSFQPRARAFDESLNKYPSEAGLVILASQKYCDDEAKLRASVNPVIWNLSSPSALLSAALTISHSHMVSKRL